MTSISALPPASYVLPNAAGAVSPRPTAPDFQSQLKTQPEHPLRLPDPTNAQVVSESTIDMARRPHVEAILQMLAWRKVTLNAPAKVGRSVPGVLASGLDIPDYRFADHNVPPQTIPELETFQLMLLGGLKFNALNRAFFRLNHGRFFRFQWAVCHP